MKEKNHRLIWEIKHQHGVFNKICLTILYHTTRLEIGEYLMISLNLITLAILLFK
jgi:uncharacterized membrane-anchored protein